MRTGDYPAGIPGAVVGQIVHVALAKVEASGFLGACGTKGFRLPARLGQKGLRKLIDGEMVDGWCWAKGS